MKKIAFILLPVFLIFSGCMPKQPLDSTFLPIALGVTQEDQYHLTVGGYVPAKSADASAEYAVRQITSEHIVNALSDHELPLGTLCVLAIDLETAKDGLYSIYAPFIYNDDSSESMYLTLCEDPAAVLKPPAADAGNPDEFLQKNDFPTPSIIGYDISMRTPQEGCVIPILALNEEGYYSIDRAAVFQNDTLKGFMTQDTFPYINLLNRRKVQLDIPYQIDDYDSGMVRMDMTCDVSVQKDAQEYFAYHITVFADGVLAASKRTDDASQDNTHLIESVVSNTIRENCLETIRQAQACSGDVFGFTRLILATDRTYTQSQLSDAFLGSTYDINVQTTIRNLTQIH